MSTAFWIKRFFTVLAIAFAIIAIGQLLKGRDAGVATLQAAIWASISATIFTVARFFQARRGVHCAICKDTPEMQEPPSR